jgi:hypothetical protein
MGAGGVALDAGGGAATASQRWHTQGIGSDPGVSTLAAGR